MGEKRKSKRHGRRLKVRFGESNVGGFPHSGLTNDVSTTGLFVVTGQTPKPGTRLHLEVMLQNEKPLYVEGVVARLVLVPPELRLIMKAGVGVRYLLGHELLSELSPALSPPKKDDPFTLTFDDEASWRAARGARQGTQARRRLRVEPEAGGAEQRGVGDGRPPLLGQDAVIRRARGARDAGRRRPPWHRAHVRRCGRCDRDSRLDSVSERLWCASDGALPLSPVRPA